MKVDIQNVTESAQSAVENQLLQDTAELGESISDRIYSLLQQSERMASELGSYVEQAKEDSFLLLGEEENIYKINENLTNTKEMLDHLINTKESDISQQMSELMIRITALQNRTLGMQVKDEVRTHVNNVIEASRNAVKMASEKFTEFFKNARTFVNQSIDKIKENVNSIHKVASECINESINDMRIKPIISTGTHGKNNDVIKNHYSNEDDLYRFKERQYSYLLADRQQALDSLNEKHQNSKGIEKLMYKVAIKRTENAIEFINQKDEQNERTHDHNIDFNKDLDKVKELAEDIDNYLIGTKVELINSAIEIRNNVVNSVINKLDSLSDRARSYAERNGIEIPKPDKEEVSVEIDEYDEDRT